MPVERWTNEMLDKLASKIDKLTDDIDYLREESKEQSIKFKYYQQATQWVVLLSFSLIAAATVTSIISAVVRK